MKKLNQYIIEKFKINSKTVSKQYTCQPKDKDELISILEKRLSKDKNADLNDIDVSEITDMSRLFSEIGNQLDPHNIKIDQWNVSNVKDMAEMFYSCNNFNCDISNWDVSNVEMMNITFYDCENFDCDLSSWDVEKVKRWNNVFGGTCGIKEEHKPKFNWKNVK
jgi:surface protein